MNRTFRIVGATACLLAVFLSVGGHWAVLQSIAWARMFADFSQTDSLAAALGKTFDGRHPCAMCLKIREGRAQEKKPPPFLKWEKLPEFVPQPARVTVPSPPAGAQGAIRFVPSFCSDFHPSPPKPPPRAA